MTSMGTPSTVATCWATATPPLGRPSTKIRPAQSSRAADSVRRSPSSSPAARRSGNGSTYLPGMHGVYPSCGEAGQKPPASAQVALRPHNREHDLRPVPEAPPRGLPGRHLVRLPASAAGAVGALRVRAAAQLDPPGLTAGKTRE